MAMISRSPSGSQPRPSRYDTGRRALCRRAAASLEQRRSHPPLVPVGREQARDVVPQAAVFADEPLPGAPTRGVPSGTGRRDDLPAVVVPADLREPFERRDPPSGRLPSALPSSSQRRSSSSHTPGKVTIAGPVSTRCPSSSMRRLLPPSSVVGLEQRHPVPGASEKRGGGEPSEAAPDDYHAAPPAAVHGYIPSENAATSCTPATVPATYGKAMEYR